MDVTAKIAEFVTELKYASIPTAAVQTAKIAVRDCLGVALAGSKEEDAKICAQIARQENAREDATVIGQGFKTSALQAAFANGTAAHALDFDHSFTLMGQPTAPIIPAIFALGESLGAGGRQLIEAYVAGYEVTGKLAHSLHDGLRIKPYPCGGLTHQVIDAVLEFRAKHGLIPEMIQAVDVDVVKHTFDRIVFRVPQTGIQGKFCMPYLVARAIIDGKIGLDIFTDSAVRDGNVLKLAERVQMNLDTNLKKTDLGGRPCRVTIRLKNGQSHSREAQHAKGGPEFPMTEEELKEKFTECARRALSPDAAQRALVHIEGLDRLDDLRTLSEILMG